jgi:uncharacterized membrane protein
VTVHRNERVLAYMIAAIVGLSIIAIVVVIVVSGVMHVRDLWAPIVLFPGIALPIGFVLIVILLVISTRRRSREAREAEAAAARSNTKKRK